MEFNLRYDRGTVFGLRTGGGGEVAVSTLSTGNASSLLGYLPSCLR
jgi:coproporphyrinogen III oxidase